jgi:hypothetical protein
MTHELITTDLHRQLIGLVAAVDALKVSSDAHSNSLAEEIREAESFSFRRAARQGRDRSCYRLGGGFEPEGGLDLDDVALSGFLHLGARAVLLLAHAAVEDPSASVVELLRRIFASDEGEVVRAWGVWRRWRWLADFYEAETAAFLKSVKGRDPKQRWRQETPTVRQEHLIREISRYLQISRPSFPTRGSAFDWIRDAGGNPRFVDAPPGPSLPQAWGR